MATKALLGADVTINGRDAAGERLSVPAEFIPAAICEWEANRAMRALPDADLPLMHRRGTEQGNWERNRGARR